MSILISGGAGFIGSNCSIEVLKINPNIIIVDNLSNSDISVLDKITKISNKTPKFYNINILDEISLNKVFLENTISAVIHFAAFKAVGESVSDPLKYYINNINGLTTLCKVMIANKVKNIIFSSSATVYGNPTSLPLTEESPISTLNPYGRTKYFGEEILRDIANVDQLKVICLRYFNPVGGHSSGLLGDDPKFPNNLFPYIISVIKGEKEYLNIYGNDYETIDGTGVRDYIHVTDLCISHVAALNYLSEMKNNFEVINLGTGVGYSVLQIVNTFSSILGTPIPYRFSPRRPGDAPEVYADCGKAFSILNWKAEKTLTDMITDSLKSLNL